MISKQSIEENMNTERLGKQIAYFDEIDSTNEQAKRMADETMDGLLVVADAQVSGKGRLGRKWDSPHGTGIFMSLLIKDDIMPLHAPMITIVAAMAVLKAVKPLVSNTYIKWPNDIVVNGKKICGILTEMKTSGEKTEYVIAGIGINVAATEFPDEIRDKATSLLLETGKRFDRTTLICDVTKHFEKYYKMFCEKMNLSLMLDEYNENMINRNRKVEIIRGDKKQIAEAVAINENGELLVRNLDNGSIETVVSGEVSVRGVYGYV